MIIDSFDGKYEFLRNDYESVAQIILDGNVYNCVQKAFQASKTDDLEIRKRIRDAPTIREANNIGRREIDLPDNWEEIKVEVMTKLIRLKFQGSLELVDKLLETGDTELVMGNSQDTFWGKNGLDGENQQGKILMKIRDELKALYPGKVNQVVFSLNE